MGTEKDEIAESHMGHVCSKHRCGRPSSYWMQDPEVLFGKLGLKEGELVIDIGCGTGDYSIHASKIVGDKGFVIAMDANGMLIDELQERARGMGILNVRALVHDITKSLPLLSGSVDLCLMATVLHIIGPNEEAETIMRDVTRALKPGGRLAVLECHKRREGFGPPESMRISPEEVEQLVIECGLERSDLTDLGFNYLIQFVKPV